MSSLLTTIRNDSNDARAALARLAQTTDVDAAANAIAAAGNELRDLEAQAARVFAHWTHAQELGKSAGLNCEIELNPGIAAALSEFKQNARRAESRRIAGEEMRATGGRP